MGMAATQARYLSLVAQQSNLEYQGQQINQERSILSQQVSELYNTLLALEVPTPPATTDYQAVQYSGNIGATQYVFDAANVKPGKDNTYIVTLGYTSHEGGVIDKDLDYSIVGKDEFKGNEVTSVSEDDLGSLYVQTGNGTVRKATASDYTKDENNNIVLNSGVTYILKDDNGANSYTTGATTVAGHDVFTSTDGKLDAEALASYEQAIARSGLLDEHGQPYTIEDFYMYFDDNNNVKFALKQDVDDGNNNTQVYSYVAGGGHQEYTQYEGCKLTFDPANGRITEIIIPNYKTNDDGTQEIVSYSTMKLTANTVTDELAYNDAMARYEYDQYEYDRKQTEINAKTEKIQEMDRNLELKLTRLDTQRQQITTEIEALEKVLEDNIEQSYKTFSG